MHVQFYKKMLGHYHGEAGQSGRAGAAAALQERPSCHLLGVFMPILVYPGFKRGADAGNGRANLF